MIANINISPLFDLPTFSEEAILFIQPLAPLSLVGSIPGSYYKSLNEPTLIMIYGMLENMLGWHFSDEIRKSIIKESQKHQKKKIKNLVFEDYESSETKYVPLLQSHIKIEYPALLKPQVSRYEDYWTQHLKGSDMRHLNGARNYDWEIEKAVNDLGNDQKEIDSFFKQNQNLFPKYYSSPKKREFIVLTGKYGYKIRTNAELLNRLTDVSQNSVSPIYLGANEGWVDINIKSL
jgi:CRISPR-associated protein Cas5